MTFRADIEVCPAAITFSTASSSVPTTGKRKGENSLTSHWSIFDSSGQRPKDRGLKLRA